MDVDKIVDQIGKDIVLEMVKILATEEKVVSGRTGDSIRYEKSMKAVVSDAEWILNIEYGRRAGAQAPPEAPIAQWLMEKFGYDRDKAEKLAYSICMKIHKEGIPAHRFIKRSVQRVMDKQDGF